MATTDVTYLGGHGNPISVPNISFPVTVGMTITVDAAQGAAMLADSGTWTFAGGTPYVPSASVVYEDVFLADGTLVKRTGGGQLVPVINNGLPSRKFRCRRPKIAVLSADFTSGWTLQNATGSDDTTLPYLVSSKVLAVAGAASGRLLKSDLSAIDLTANGLVLATRVPDYSLVNGNLDVDYSSDSFSTFQTGGNLKQDLRQTPPGEWVLHPLQPTSATSITASAVTGFRVKGTAQAGGYSIGFGLLGTWPLDGKARAVHIIDDSLDTAYEACMRAIAKGVKPCVAVRPGALDTAGHMTTVQARTLHDRYGVEFIPHAYNVADHDNVDLYKDPAAFEASLKNLRDACIAKGLINGIEHYCYAPNYDGGRDTAAKIIAYDLVAKYHPGLARTGNTAGYNGAVESQAPFDFERRLRVGMYTTGTNSALSNLQGLMDRTVFTKGVSITVNHGLATSASGLIIDRTTYDSFMGEIGVTRAGTIISCTLSEAFAA